MSVGVATVFWGIWKARNQACFENKWPSEPIKVLHRIGYWINWWTNSQASVDAKLELQLGTKLLGRVTGEVFRASRGWAQSCWVEVFRASRGWATWRPRLGGWSEARLWSKRKCYVADSWWGLGCNLYLSLARVRASLLLYFLCSRSNLCCWMYGLLLAVGVLWWIYVACWFLLIEIGDESLFIKEEHGV